MRVFSSCKCEGRQLWPTNRCRFSSVLGSWVVQMDGYPDAAEGDTGNKGDLLEAPVTIGFRWLWIRKLGYRLRRIFWAGWTWEGPWSLIAPRLESSRGYMFRRPLGIWWGPKCTLGFWERCLDCFTLRLAVCHTGLWQYMGGGSAIVERYGTSWVPWCGVSSACLHELHPLEPARGQGLNFRAANG